MEGTILDQTVIPGEFAKHDLVVIAEHVNEYTHQEKAEVLADYDDWCARRAMALLLGNFPGYTWCVRHQTTQGVCLISIPILMGVNKWIAINLKTHDLTPGTVIAAGGEILERYNQPRTGFHLESFLEARAKHSALVNRFRPVPS